MRTLWLSLLLASIACSKADVRPRGLPKIASDSNGAQGRAWLTRARQARGGDAALVPHKALRLVFRDTWRKGADAPVSNPWDEDGLPVQLDLELASNDAKLTVLAGEAAGEIWGVHAGATYRVTPEGEVEQDTSERPDETLSFWLSRFAFFAFPLRTLVDAPLVQFAGIQDRGFRDHAVVYATWPETQQTDAQDAEQYVVWIDTETEQVRFIDHTLRSEGSGLETTVAFEDYLPVEALALPRKISELGDDGRAVHRVEVDHASFFSDLEPDYFEPGTGSAAKSAAAP